MNQSERIGRFEVQERIRGDSFALIYRGTDPFDGRSVQIKVCVAADEEIRRRFLLAAEDLTRLRHDNITTVFEFGSGNSKPYLVQEAFSETSVSDLLVHGDPIDDVLKLHYVVQIARGLKHAHTQGVLHRELRPASVLVSPQGKIKLTDFGIARLASALGQLGSGAHRWSTVGWLIPELLLGLELDTRSDIYGFGALAYELLANRGPFPAESLATLVPRVLEDEPEALSSSWPECPAELDQLILRCLRRDPRRRFGSMKEVIEELDSILPVTTTSDVFEEEETAVTTELQTVYVAEPGAGEQGPRAAGLGLKLPDLRQISTVVRAWASRSATAIRAVAGSLAERALPASGLDPARLRTAVVVVLSALLFGVVGWSLVRLPESPESSTPSEAQAESLGSSEATGLLIVDALPWAEVVRVVDMKGNAAELPKDRFTPLPMELPPGRYRVELSRPDLSNVQTCVVIVSEGTTGRCEPRFASIEVADFFKETGWWQ